MYLANYDLSRTIRKAIKSFEPTNDVQRKHKAFLIGIMKSPCDYIKFLC